MFFPSEKWHFIYKNLSSPTVFDLDGWNKHNFVRNWMPYNHAGVFFCVPSVSSKKNVKRWKICIKTWKVLKKCFKYFSKIKKNAACDALLKGFVIKSNHKFCSISEIVVEDNFPQDSQKAYIFYENNFLYVLQKKSRDKLCLEPCDRCVLFVTFFSLR